MTRFLCLGEKYLKEMDLIDMGMLKVCLLSVGIILGISLPKGVRKVVVFFAAIFFLVTYIPLISKLFRVYKER